MLGRGLPVRNSLAILAVAAVTSAGTGCDNPFGGCTLVGCFSGITVTFDAAPPPGTVVELESPLSVPWRVECGVDWDCQFDIPFYEFTPSSLTVRVVTPTGEVTESLNPEYRNRQPNGGGCGPTCRVATIQIELPA
jgi:hypothetical protein